MINIAVLFRQEIVCGLQSVTRCLERDKLRLVIVDRSSPWRLHLHLAQLSAVRRCPAVAVDNMAKTLCAVLSVTRLCALGFKVNYGYLQGSNFVVDRVHCMFRHFFCTRSETLELFA